MFLDVSKSNVMGALCVDKAEKYPSNLLRIMPAKEIAYDYCAGIARVL